MNEKNLISEENDDTNDITSLNTNITKDDNNDNHKSSLAKKSSESIESSFFRSFEKGKTDLQEVENKKIEIRKKIIHPDDCFLIKMIWFLGYLGFHRYLLLIFRCDICEKNFYVCMEKTKSGKKLHTVNQNWTEKLWSEKKWEYIIKNKRKINYNYCEQCFDEASGDWTILSNNCKDFTKYIWEKIKNIDKD